MDKIQQDFVVGDVVALKHSGTTGNKLIRAGDLGTVVGLRRRGELLMIQWAHNVGGHTCDGHAKNGHGWDVDASKVYLYEPYNEVEIEDSVLDSIILSR